MTRVPQAEVTGALAAEYTALDALLSALEPDEWRAASPCPGWDVHDVVAHIVGTELAQAGDPPPRELPTSWKTAHLHNEIAVANERWVAAFADTPPAELLSTFREITRRRMDSLRTMASDAWDAELPTPAGLDSYGRFMRIRVFDCWMHEQDIRDAVGRAGHDEGPELDFVLDEISSALGYVVAKKAGAPTGSSVTFDLTGPAGRRIHVLVEARASVVDELDTSATVTLRLPVMLFTRLCGGRTDSTAENVEIFGDEALGRRVLANLAYTI
jgi:uncharacterized protein (TIGR03083 family)